MAKYHTSDSRCVKSVYVLGDKIHNPSRGEDGGALVQEQLRERRDRIAWFTYRRFARLNTRDGKAFTSDAGWGCTVRTGQMLLAEALQRVWRTHCSGAPVEEQRLAHLARLARLFADERRPTHGPDPGAAPFGLQAIVERGATAYDVPIGQWYGPSTVCSVLRDLVDAQPRATRLAQDGGAEGELAVLVAENGVVYASEVHSLCGGAPAARRAPRPHEDPLLRTPATPRGAATPWRRALLLLMPLRLGLGNTIDAKHATIFQTALSLPQSVGVIGGRGGRSVYWFAYEDDEADDGGDGVVHALDPHTVQPALRGTEQPSTMRAPSSLCVPLRSMNPSVALGFVCRSREEYSQLERAFQTYFMPDAPIAAHAEPPSSTVYAGEDYDSSCTDDDIEDTYVVVHMH